MAFFCIPIAVRDEVSMCNVDAVINAESNDEDVTDAGDDVDILAEVEAHA